MLQDTGDCLWIRYQLLFLRDYIHQKFVNVKNNYYCLQFSLAVSIFIPRCLSSYGNHLIFESLLPVALNNHHDIYQNKSTSEMV